MFKKFNTDYDRKEFCRLRKLVKVQIRTSFNTYISDAQNSLVNNPKAFWSFIRSRKGDSRIPGIMHLADETYSTPQDIVNGFKNYFSTFYRNPGDASSSPVSCTNAPCIHLPQITDIMVNEALAKLKDKQTAGYDEIPCFLVKDCRPILISPLCTIFNLALRSQHFPSIWSIAKICPIHKTGKQSDIANYRPISILCAFSKVFEMVLYDFIYPLVRNYISPHQHGFMRHRSTTTNLACFTNYACHILDNHGQVDVIYTDFQKAFDTIDHSIIINKLDSIGFSQSLLQLFTSYLSHRSQYVTYNDFTSDLYVASSGVPQGSNLGPLLFLIFINDIGAAISNHFLLFADDLKLYYSISSINDCLFLQDRINAIFSWCIANNLHLNIKKCKVISFTRRRNPVLYDYTLNAVSLNRVVSTTDLGVVFDNELRFAEHVRQVSSSATKTLGFLIRNSKNFTNLHTMFSLYYSLVRPKLEYCCLIWYPIYDVHIKAVEGIQRKFLKYMSFRVDGVYPARGSSQELLLERFSFESLSKRRISNSIKFLHGIITNHVDCPSLLESLNISVPAGTSRFPKTFLNPIPKTNILSKSPSFIMSRNFNIYCRHADINFSPLSEILKFV
uniref:Reverse transcriptase domain-containing protein n=1 Tax=Photinus pyralis TaxID=7054 RepID=A0A1Y1KS26_PHOPY